MDLPNTKRLKLKQKTASKLYPLCLKYSCYWKNSGYTLSKNTEHCYDLRKNYDDWGC